VVIAKSDRKTEAHEFLDWMLSPEQQGRLKDFGLAAVK
jgi:molybdate transport system substrate-binding protein